MLLYMSSSYSETGTCQLCCMPCADRVWVLFRSVALGSGTERAFTGKTINGYSHDTKAKGMCVPLRLPAMHVPSVSMVATQDGRPQRMASCARQHLDQVLIRMSGAFHRWVSAVGGLPLFSSETKFESGTGQPLHTPWRCPVLACPAELCQ